MTDELAVSVVELATRVYEVTIGAGAAATVIEPFPDEDAKVAFPL